MKILDNVELNDLVFNLEPKDSRDRDIISRVVTWQLARRQTGNHKTKQVGEVRGTTKKMYRQKGTGGARHGSKRATQFRGGGIIFGPVVRDHSFDIPKKVRDLALRIALSDKKRNNQLFVVDEIAFNSHKTKDAINTIKSLDLNGSVLFIKDTLRCGKDLLPFIDRLGNINDKDGLTAQLALRNLKDYNIIQSIGTNVYDILSSDVLVLSQGAVNDLVERLK